MRDPFDFPNVNVLTSPTRTALGAHSTGQPDCSAASASVPESVEGVLHVGAVVPQPAAEPADRPLALVGVTAHLLPVELGRETELVERPAAGERRKQIRGWDAVVRPHAALERGGQGGQKVGGFARRGFVQLAEDLQHAHTGRGRVGAAPLHGGDFDVPAVRPAPRLHERRQLLRVRGRAVEQLQTERDEEARVRAAVRGTGRFAVAAVGRAERFQRTRHALAPVGWRVGEYVRTAAERHQITTHHQGEEIHHPGRTGHLRAEEPGRLAADVRVEGLEHRQRAEREPGVVQVRTALAPGEAAVRVLGFEQVSGVPPADLVGQSLDPVEQPAGEACQVRFGFGHDGPSSLARMSGGRSSASIWSCPADRQNTDVMRPAASGSPRWFVKSNR